MERILASFPRFVGAGFGSLTTETFCRAFSAVFGPASQSRFSVVKRRGKVGRVGGRELVSVGHRRTIAGKRERGKNMRGAILLAAVLWAAPAWLSLPTFPPEGSFRGGRDPDQNTHLLAEVIASAFASGLSWPAGVWRQAGFCPPPDLKGAQAMSCVSAATSRPVSFPREPS